jgi:hypothetical protein
LEIISRIHISTVLAALGGGSLRHGEPPDWRLKHKSDPVEGR